MKLKILSSAIDDLYEARLFYEKQGGEWGIISLIHYFRTLILAWSTEACMRNSMAIIVCYPSAFLTPCTIPWKVRRMSLFGGFWIYVKIQRRFGKP